MEQEQSKKTKEMDMLQGRLAGKTDRVCASGCV